MRIYKVLADKRPSSCLLCPLENGGIKIDKSECGTYREIKDGDWVTGCKMPDDRCLFVEAY